MRFNFLITAIVSLSVISIQAQSQQCKKWIEQLAADIISLDIQNIPLPSIMFSGINPNSPGQQYECMHTNNSDFTYYLTYTTNFSTRTNTYTGICVPNNCTLQDIQTVLQPYNSKVYELNGDFDLDAWAIIGLTAILLWTLVLVVASIWASCKQSIQESQKTKQDMNQSHEQSKSQDKRLQHGQSRKSDRGSVQTQAIQSFKENWNLFNYYAGYQKIFLHSPHKNMMSLFNILAVLGFAISVEFSYKQQIAANYLKAPELLENAGGIFVCNTQIAFSVILFVLGLKLAYGVYKITSFRQMGRYFFSQVLKKWIFLILMTLATYGILNTIDSPLRKIWQLKYGKDCSSSLWQFWFLFRNLQFDDSACLPWFSLPTGEILFTIIAVPIIILFRVSKPISNSLMLLMAMLGIIIGVVILDHQLVFYRPQKLFNNPWQFTFKYQNNPLVRMTAFFFGLFFGLFVLEGLEKYQNQPRKIQYKLAKRIKRNDTLRLILHILGLAGMFLSFVSIIFILTFQDRSPEDDQSNIYAYLVTVPSIFLLSLTIFMLPVFWEAKGSLTNFAKKILGLQLWVHLDRISLTFFILTPAVIGYTTFSMQSSIYYDANTLITYLIGDLAIIYLLSLLVVAGVENQLVTLNAWLQTKVFGSHNKYSVLVVQQ